MVSEFQRLFYASVILQQTTETVLKLTTKIKYSNMFSFWNGRKAKDFINNLHKGFFPILKFYFLQLLLNQSYVKYNLIYCSYFSKLVLRILMVKDTFAVFLITIF